jgi:hypothetical protein
MPSPLNIIFLLVISLQVARAWLRLKWSIGNLISKLLPTLAYLGFGTGGLLGILGVLGQTIPNYMQLIIASFLAYLGFANVLKNVGLVPRKLVKYVI